MNKSKKSLILMSLILFFITAIISFTDYQFLFELLSPITIWLIFLLLATNIDGLGPYKKSCFFIGMGILCLALCDTVRFTNHYIFHMEPYSDLLRFIYVMPSFFYALNETIYLYLKLKNRKRELSHLFVNSFCFSIIGFAVIYKIYVDHAGKISDLVQLSYIMFIFIAFYVVMMCIQTFCLVGLKNIFRGPNLITASLIIYEICDIHYVFSEAIGLEPDSNLGDLIYMICILIITIGTTIQVEKKYVIDFQPIVHSAKTTKFRFTIALIGIITSVLMIPAGILDSKVTTNIIVVLLAYIIMINLLYTGELKEKQNELLEQMVSEKTKELEDANSKLELLSSTDALTKLNNRRFFDIFLNNMCNNPDAEFAIFCLDLNKFKPVNDTYGHDMGDKVLQEFGRRMRQLSREYHCFRTGGDEFIIITDLKMSALKPQEHAEKLGELFRLPVEYESYVFNLSASIGGAICPTDSRDPDKLLQYADAAMYTVKRSGNKDGIRFFSNEMVALISLQEQLRARLENVVPEKDFVLYYQPQINVKKCEITGFEIFPHLRGDMERVSPAELIPIAEECGIMSDLGIWVISTALDHIHDWNQKYHKNLSLTINLSPLQLIDTKFFDSLWNEINTLNMSPESVILDVANSIIMGAASSAKESMKNLHDQGFRLSLNDFGGDDINLSYVLDCGFTGIKLSRSLVSAEDSIPNTRVLINSITSLAKNMNIEVTAVGIETKSQEERMLKYGITTLQGYLYGKPTNAEEAEALLKEELQPS